MDISIDIKSREIDVIEAAIRHEKWAQKWIYEEHFGHMMGICLRYARDEQQAQDMLHDGFIKVFKNMSKYSPGTSLQAWIKRIMVNNCIDQYRRETKKRTEELENAEQALDLNPDIVSLMSEKDILESVQKLPSVYRAVFNMYVIEGYPHKDISDMLGISESTSRSNLVKARSKLKHLLKTRLKIQRHE